MLKLMLSKQNAENEYFETQRRQKEMDFRPLFLEELNKLPESVKTRDHARLMLQLDKDCLSVTEDTRGDLFEFNKNTRKLVASYSVVHGLVFTYNETKNNENIFANDVIISRLDMVKEIDTILLNKTGLWMNQAPINLMWKYLLKKYHVFGMPDENGKKDLDNIRYGYDLESNVCIIIK